MPPKEHDKQHLKLNGIKQFIPQNLKYTVILNILVVKNDNVPLNLMYTAWGKVIKTFGVYPST